MRMRVEDSCLVVIDEQERLCAAMSEFDVTRTALLAAAAKELGVPVLATEQNPERLGGTLPQVVAAWPEATKVFPKFSYSCWGEPEFAGALRRLPVKNVILTGVETHVCLQQTAFELMDEGYRVIVAKDAVASRRTSDRDTSLSLLLARGVMVTTAESIVFEWLGTARHPSFKTILKLVK
ncbi:MAG: isochorismatase family protein [Victivallaceae bacterium]|nr:isochorismatase family protein [Victivallaceae bacterium]